MSVNILTENGLKKVDGGASSEAKGIAYNPTTSGLAADDVQEAIDEINGNLSDKQDKTDNGIKTNAKTVVGAINELLNGLVTKQNKEDSTLATDSKNVVGAINEINGDLSAYIDHPTQVGSFNTPLISTTDGWFCVYGRSANGNFVEVLDGANLMWGGFLYSDGTYGSCSPLLMGKAGHTYTLNVVSGGSYDTHFIVYR